MIRPANILAAASLALCLAANANPVLPPEITIDITAIINPVAPGEGLGYQAIGFDGTNYWMARWGSSRVTRISTAGVFVDSFDIAGLSGIRSITWDGTHFWMANNTTTLTRVDPSTGTMLGTITVPVQSRYASYDPTADGGQGGFWIGNYTGDILLVSMQGTTLSTLPEANIGYSSRSGLALDRSGASPRLWTYFQGGTNNVDGPAAIEIGIAKCPWLLRHRLWWVRTCPNAVAVAMDPALALRKPAIPATAAAGAFG